MKDACEPLKHRQIDAASAEQGINVQYFDIITCVYCYVYLYCNVSTAAEAWRLNMEEMERLEKVRQEERLRHRTVYTVGAADGKK